MGFMGEVMASDLSVIVSGSAGVNTDRQPVRVSGCNALK